MEQILLKARNLTRQFKENKTLIEEKKVLTAVDHVDFDIYEGEILGLLGTSGCGKSTIAKMLCGIEKADDGKIIYKGTELQKMSKGQFCQYRREIQMIFQNPFDCLDPQISIERQLMEPMRVWKMGRTSEQREEIRKLCEECRIPEKDLGKRPAEFSGGQLQRISIIRSLLLKPEFLIADEVVSALDVSVQNQVLELLLRMKEKYKLTILFITHDLAVMKKMADRIMVMKNGKIIETGTFQELNHSDGNSYFKKLMDASYFFEPKPSVNVSE